MTAPHTIMSGLEFRDIRKSFGAVQALKGVSFSVAEGTAHALVGENGAGKSTLLKILAGIVHPDAGELHWQGERLALGSPRGALECGIGMVYQEMLSFPNLSVSANIFAGRELTSRGRLLEPQMRARTRVLLDDLHLAIDPDARAESLSAAHRQLLQVARALAFECRILVLDEPTTSLTDAEADHLFTVLQRLKARGTTLLYVSHRLPEVFRLCDVITVLRDGAYVASFPRADAAPGEIVRAMVGRDLPPRAEHARKTGRALLAIAGLTREPCFRDVTLHVNAGELVGLFGLVGSGRSELLETIFGLAAPDRGEIRTGGTVVTLGNPRQAARAGIALVPEERQRQGLFFNLSVRHNLMLPSRTAAGTVIIRSRRGAARIERIDERLAHQGGRHGRRPRTVAERRQPAEGRPGQVARHDAARPAPRRTDQRRGRGREVRDSRNHPAPGGRRAGLPDRVERPARSALALRSDRRHARGTRAGRNRRRRRRPKKQSCGWRRRNRDDAS